MMPAFEEQVAGAMTGGMGPQESPQEEMAEPADEELQQAKDKVAAEVIRGVMSDQFFDGLLARLEQSPDPLAQIGKEAAQAVKVFDGGVDDSLPDEIIAPVAMEVAAEIASAIAKSGALTLDEQTQQVIMEATVKELAKLYGGQQ